MEDVDLPRYPVAMGLWKGDLTLKRTIADEMEKLRRSGGIAKIISRYVGAACNSANAAIE
jgi:hypothetical protein